MAERGKSRSRLKTIGGVNDLTKFPTGFVRAKDACSDGPSVRRHWNALRADDPFRDYANDSELRIAIGKKLLNLAAHGVTDPVRLRKLTVESLLFPHQLAEEKAKAERLWWRSQNG